MANTFDILWALAAAAAACLIFAFFWSLHMNVSYSSALCRLWDMVSKSHQFSSGQGAICFLAGISLFEGRIHPLITSLGILLIILGFGCAGYTVAFNVMFGLLNARDQWNEEKELSIPYKGG